MIVSKAMLPVRKMGDPNNDFDLTRFFVTLLAGSPDARMAPTARLGYDDGARAKLAGQINVRATKAQ